tara:strand:+ start:3036 stop:3278 length:243 start_codon:yes stop_codon:yes gene_type:complete
MFKNFIIMWLGFIVFSLMVQKPENFNLIVKDTVQAKEMVENGFTYAKNSYEILTNPKAYIESIEPVESKTIQEETWFNEK